METIQNLLDTMNLNMARFVANPYISAILLIIVIMYAGMAAPVLPKWMAHLFDYTVFKILILALILFVFNFNPSLAIIMAIAFFITLQTLSRWKLNDFAGEVTRIKKIVGLKAEAEKKEEGPVKEDQASFDAMYGLSNAGETNMDTQVSGLAARTPYYDGPQGMEHPVGYTTDMQGADANF